MESPNVPLSFEPAIPYPVFHLSPTCGIALPAGSVMHAALDLSITAESQITYYTTVGMRKRDSMTIAMLYGEVSRCPQSTLTLPVGHISLDAA